MAEQPAAARRRASTSVVIRLAGHAGLAALFIAVAVLGVLSGVMFAYAGDLPQISALDNYAPSAITRIYARGGETLAEFAIEKRLLIGYDDIAPQLRQAIIVVFKIEPPQRAFFISHNQKLGYGSGISIKQ